MLTRRAAVLTEGVLATLVAVGCFSAGSFVPFLGAMLTLLSPIPPVILALRYGRSALWGCLLAASLVLALFGSRWLAAAFVLEFVGPAWILAEGLRRGRRAEVLGLAGAVCLTLGGLAVLLLGASSWDQPLAAVRQHLEVLLREAEQLTARLGMADGPEASAAAAAQIRRWLLLAFPGLFFAGNLLAAVGYDAGLRWLLRRRPTAFGVPVPAGWQWRIPESLIWAFIGSGVLYLTGIEGLAGIGLNGLIALLALYFFQGVSIALYWVQRFQLPRFLVTVSVVVLMLQPLAMLLLAGVGLFDVWCAFRRPSLPDSPGGVS